MNAANWTWTTISAALGEGSPRVVVGIVVVVFRPTIDYIMKALVDDWRESRRIKRIGSMSPDTYERWRGTSTE